MVVTEEVFQNAILLLNDDARANIAYILVTEEVFQSAMLSLNEDFSANKLPILVTLLVSQVLISPYLSSADCLVAEFVHSFTAFLMVLSSITYVVGVSVVAFDVVGVVVGVSVGVVVSVAVGAFV